MTDLLSSPLTSVGIKPAITAFNSEVIGPAMEQFSGELDKKIGKLKEEMVDLAVERFNTNVVQPAIPAFNANFQSQIVDPGMAQLKAQVVDQAFSDFKSQFLPGIIADFNAQVVDKGIEQINEKIVTKAFDELKKQSATTVEQLQAIPDRAKVDFTAEIKKTLQECQVEFVDKAIAKLNSDVIDPSMEKLTGAVELAIIAVLGRFKRRIAEKIPYIVAVLIAWILIGPIIFIPLLILLAVFNPLKDA